MTTVGSHHIHLNSEAYVCTFPQGYFKDISVEDVYGLLPALACPDEDPMFCVPPVGMSAEQEKAAAKHHDKGTPLRSSSEQARSKHVHVSMQCVRLSSAALEHSAIVRHHKQIAFHFPWT